MRTTLTLEDDVAARLERLRKERDGSLKAVVNELLRRGLDAVDREDESGEPYVLEPWEPGRCHLPDLDDVAGVLAVAEGDDFR